MNESSQRLSNRQGYDLWSASYDRYPNPTVAADELHFPPRWRHLTGRNVVEVGCGTGRHTVRLAAQRNRVTGIDLSPGMLGVAREKLRGFPGVVLHEGDFLRSQVLPAGAFDALLASLVIEHVSDLATFFARARQVLGSVGEVHLSEIHPARTAQGILAHFKTADGAQIDLDSVPHPDGAIEAAAQSAGFELLDRTDAVGDERLSRLNPKWVRYEGVPLIRMWQFRRREPPPNPPSP